MLHAERRLLAELAPTLDEARSEGLELVWLVHKDPGIRLRLGGRALPGDLRARVEVVLGRLRAEGAVDDFGASVYEPEVFLLGGPQATALVHRYFDRDTAAFMAWEAEQGERALPITATVFSLGVMVDLFERCVGPREEVWDVWCNLHRIHGGADEPLDAPAIGLSQLCALGGPRIEPLAEHYAAANAALAAGLERQWRAGALTAGRRSLLPTVAAFHWNRYRIGPSTLARMASAMVTAYDPRRGLAGHEPAPPPGAP